MIYGFNSLCSRVYFFLEYYGMYRNNATLTSNEAWAKALIDAYKTADGFDHCVEDVMSTAWWAFVSVHDNCMLVSLGDFNF